MNVERVEKFVVNIRIINCPIHNEWPGIVMDTFTIVEMCCLIASSVKKESNGDNKIISKQTAYAVVYIVV